MRLFEITKKQFKNALVNPRNALLRQKIVEYRKELNSLGFNTRTSYNKYAPLFIIRVKYPMMSFDQDLQEIHQYQGIAWDKLNEVFASTDAALEFSPRASNYAHFTEFYVFEEKRAFKP